VLTTEQALAKTDLLYARLSKRRPEIAQAEDYFEGKQPLTYASQEWREFHGERFSGFADNWCGVVGAAAPELTEISGIRLGDDVDAMSVDEQQLWRDWDSNNGPAQSAQGFQSGAITKRSFALVWGDRNGEPVLTWEHSSQVIVDGDLSLKAWVDDDRELATLYEPDGVWKWQRPSVAGSILNGRTGSGLYVTGAFAGLGGGWRPRQDPEDDVWPLPNPLRVNPMVEFPNRPLLRRGPISDIQGTIAMQNAANLMWAYLFGAADFASLPGRVVMGQEPPKVPILDENGQKIGEKPVDRDALTKGRMLWLTGQNAKIGQYTAASLDVFTNVIDVMVKHIAAQTKTPINYMGALSNVNGETLDGLRDPLYMKVRDGHRYLTAPTRAVFRRLALVREDKATAEACRAAQILWRNPETATDAQTSDAALKDKQVGWSAAGILERRYGMSQPEIARELARRQAEAEDPLLAGLLRDVTPVAPDAAGG